MGSISYILSAVELLRALKTVYPYSALSQKTGLAKSVLCRYVKGTNLPSEGTATELHRSLSQLTDLRLLVSKKLKQDVEGYLDSTTVSCDPAILNWAGREILTKYGNKHFTKILTAATDGIPLASAAAMRLGLPLIIAKRNKEVGIRSFLEESYIGSSPVSVTTLYVPRDSIAPGDRVLIVDNIVRTGRTVNVLLNVVKKAKPAAVSLYILIAVGDNWRKTLSAPPNIPIEVVFTLPSTPTKQVEKTLAA